MKNNKLFYVVEKLTQDVGDDIQELTGWKTITVYEILNNQPKMFCEFEGENAKPNEAEIQEYLDNNGYGDDEFEFTQL